MATPQFDSNTWYSLQSFGTQYYLDCNSISICGAGTDARTNFEWFQINRPANNTPLYIRPKAQDVDQDGQPFCINLSTGQPFLSLCTNESAIWGTGYWNGQDSGDGLFFYSTERSSTQRLSLNEDGVWSLPDYNNLTSSDVDQMRWNVSRLGDINDESYSAVPAVITGLPTAIASSSSATSSETTTLPTSSASSAPDSLSSSVASTLSSDTSTITVSGSTSTLVFVVTPTVTATTGDVGSGTSTASATTPTLQSSAVGKTAPSVRVLAMLSMVILALQTGPWSV